MIELVEVHEPKIKIVFGKDRAMHMIDTDFEQVKKDGIKTEHSIQPLKRNTLDFTYDGERIHIAYPYGKPRSITPPDQTKPFWIERFLRWWYDI